MSRYPLRKIFFFVFSFISFLLCTRGQTNTAPSPDIQKYLIEAASALRANRPADAEQAYQSILKIDPANADARANLGIVAMVEQDWAKAAENLKNALKFKPTLWNAQALLAVCELHLEKVSEATDLLLHALPKLNEPKLRMEAGFPFVQVLEQKGELDRAASVLAAMQELDPANPDLLYASYRVHTDLAMKAVESMALAAPNSVQLHRALAEHAINEARTDDAIAEYRKALEVSPNSAAVHYEYGQVLVLQSHMEPNLSLAQKEFGTALALSPGDAKPECELAKIARWRSDSKTAAEHYEKAATVNPDLACAQLGIAETLIENGKSTEALAHLESAARASPFDPEVHHRLGLLYLKLGRQEDANREKAKFKELQQIRDQMQKTMVESHN